MLITSYNLFMNFIHSKLIYSELMICFLHNKSLEIYNYLVSDTNRNVTEYDTYVSGRFITFPDSCLKDQILRILNYYYLWSFVAGVIGLVCYFCKVTIYHDTIV